MTIAQIAAIVSLLLAFGVDTTTAEHIRILISPPEASSTPVAIVPVVQTPITPNQPVYFGSTPPAPAPTPTPTPPPPPVPKDTTPPSLLISEIVDGVLRIMTNEVIASIMTSEGSITETLIDGKVQPNRDYYYEYHFTGFTKLTEVTVADAAGNETTFRPRFVQ